MITPVFVPGTDNALIINAAIDAAAGSGGDTVFLSPDAWELRSPVYLKTGVQLIGAAKIGTILLDLFDGADAIQIDGYNSYGRLSDFTIKQPSPRSAGASIAIRGGASNWVLRNINFDGPLCGLSIGFAATIWIDEIEMANVQQGNGVGVLVNGGNDHYLRDIFVKSRSAGQPCYACFRVQQTGALWMEGCGGLWGANGLQIDPPSGQVVEHIFSSMNAWDSCSGNGILIQPAGGTVRRCKFVQDWTATNSAHGIATVAAGTIDDIGFIGHRSFNNKLHGAYIFGGRGITFSDATVAGNSGAATGNFSGIYFEGGTSDFGVFNSRCGNAGGFGVSQGWGICVPNGPSNRYRIIGNDCSGNVSGPIHDGGSGTTKVVLGNF